MKMPSWKNVPIRPGKRIKSFIIGFRPSKYSSIIFVIFFIGGFLFAFMDPAKAQSTFDGGFLLNQLTAQFIPPNEISFQYFMDQFVFFLGKVSWGIFSNNLVVSLECIFSGFLIIPVILINLFGFLGSVFYFLITKFGAFKGFIFLFGSFHLVFEVGAAILVIDAFITFYGTLIDSLRQRSLKRFKHRIWNEFIPLVLRIIILLAIAAILEVFWSTWWVYILTHPYISWIDFYTSVYSCVF